MMPSTYVQVACLRGSLAGKVFAFIDPAPRPLPQPLLLGRSPDCQICFQGATETMISRRHVALRLTADGVEVSDSSTHGTFLAKTVERVTRLSVARGAQAVLQLGPGGPLVRVAVGAAFPLGNYSLVAKIGEGGMAGVFLAADRRLDRFVVLKLLRPDLRNVDALAEQRLLAEARIIAQLEHHNVVRIYELGELGELGGVPFLAMEYLRGVSLGQLIGRLNRSGKRLAPPLAAAIMAQACLGLHAAHELPARVVHRDVSPSNILITRDSVKVIDFGIARTSAPGGDKPVTAPNITAGCPPYMSPEQVAAPQTVTRLSDIFSAAAVLYELCAGASAFSRGNMVATMAAVLTHDLPPLRSVCEQASPRLEQVLQQALAKDPAERQPATAAALAALLKEEAGPQLQSHDRIASALEELGIDFHGLPPLPLSEEPELVRRARPVAAAPALSPPPRHAPPLRRPPALAGAFPAAQSGALPAAADGPGLGGGSPQPEGQAARAAGEDAARSAASPGDSLLPVALPEEDGAFELAAALIPRVCVTCHELHPHRNRGPIPLALNLEGLLSEFRRPLVAALTNRVIELRVAPETLKAGRTFRIYPAELSTSGGRNSYTLPLPCAGKPLLIGHHRGEHRGITVASSLAAEHEPAPPGLALAELGIRLTAPAGTDRLFAIYSIDPDHGCAHVACFTVRR